MSKGREIESGVEYASNYPEFYVKRYNSSEDFSILQQGNALAIVTDGQGRVGVLEIKTGDSLLIQEPVVVQTQHIEIFLCSGY